MYLTDEDFDRVLHLKKMFDGSISLPTQNERRFYTLKSEDGTDHFELNIERKTKIELRKIKINHSYFKEPIIRLEIDAPPHQNPNGIFTERNHIHVYKEGFGMSWAYNLSDFHDELFLLPENFFCVFNDFCVYCNIELDAKLQGVF